VDLIENTQVAVAVLALQVAMEPLVDNLVLAVQEQTHIHLGLQQHQLALVGFMQAVVVVLAHAVTITVKQVAQVVVVAVAIVVKLELTAQPTRAVAVEVAGTPHQLVTAVALAEVEL
jgi:hypothetical protein